MPTYDAAGILSDLQTELIAKEEKRAPNGTKSKGNAVYLLEWAQLGLWAAVRLTISAEQGGSTQYGCTVVACGRNQLEVLRTAHLACEVRL